MNISLTRRQILSRGLAASAGVSFSALLTQRAAQADIKNYESTEGTAKGVIFIFMLTLLIMTPTDGNRQPAARVSSIAASSCMY